MRITASERTTERMHSFLYNHLDKFFERQIKLEQNAHAVRTRRNGIHLVIKYLQKVKLSHVRHQFNRTIFLDSFKCNVCHRNHTTPHRSKNTVATSYN